MMPAKSKGRAKTAKNHHKLCQPLPKGDVLKDLLGKSWKIGEPIGSGGFGLIYSGKLENNLFIEMVFSLFTF